MNRRVKYIDPRLFDLFCYEELSSESESEMEPYKPSITEARNFFIQLQDKKIPWNIKEGTGRHWSEFVQYIEYWEVPKYLIDCVIPTKMLVDRWPGRKLADGQYECYVCKPLKKREKPNELFSEMYEIEGSVLSFLTDKNNYCLHCERRCFNIIHTEYVDDIY